MQRWETAAARGCRPCAARTVGCYGVRELAWAPPPCTRMPRTSKRCAPRALLPTFKLAQLAPVTVDRHFLLAGMLVACLSTPALCDIRPLS